MTAKNQRKLNFVSVEQSFVFGFTVKRKKSFAEEIFTEEIFAEFIFAILTLIRKNFFRKKNSKFINRKNFFRKILSKLINRKNFFRKNFQMMPL